MSRQFFTTFTKSIDVPVCVSVPDGLETEELYGKTYVKSKTEPRTLLSLEVAANRGLVTVERLHPSRG